MARSERIRRMVSEIRDLSDEEFAELESELLVLDVAMERAWGEEIDRRASRVLNGETSGITRDQMMALFTLPPAEAQAQLAKITDTRR
jgi:hypothetical protein